MIENIDQAEFALFLHPLLALSQFYISVSLVSLVCSLSPHCVGSRDQCADSSAQDFLKIQCISATLMIDCAHSKSVANKRKLNYIYI